MFLALIFPILVPITFNGFLINFVVEFVKEKKLNYRETQIVRLIYFKVKKL